MTEQQIKDHNYRISTRVSARPSPTGFDLFDRFTGHFVAAVERLGDARPLALEYEMVIGQK